MLDRMVTRPSDGLTDARLELTRLLAARPELVWDALTSADALESWFWPESLGTEVGIDLRAGGLYRIAGPGAGIAVSGRYQDVEPRDRLAFTWRWDGEQDETLVTIRLTASGTGTELALTHDGFADDSQRDNHVQGWSDCLDRLTPWLDGR